MRGTIHPVRRASLTGKAREVLRADLDIPVVSFEDLYGGKLVAAMDRQHPRDLFDAMQLFAHEGITPGIRRAFVIWQVTIGQFTKYCFRRLATSPMSMREHFAE